MAKNKISEYSNVAANNTDIGSINIAEGCAPSGINNAIRELMAQLKDMQTGADGDNFTVGGALSVTGASNLTGVLTLTNALAATSGGTGFSSYTTGDILFASGSTALSKLGIAASGNVLRSGATPSWGKVNLTTDVTGALPAVNGGTGTTTSTGTGANVLSDSPAFTGTPTAPTASTGTNTTQVATTAFVQAAVTQSQSGLADTGANGIVVRTSQGVTAARSLTNGTGITISNADGVSANPVISVSNLGINTSQIADSSVTNAKIANSAVTAAKLSGGQSGSAPIFGARAWVNFDGSGAIGGSATIRAHGNVSSVTKTASGTYQINFSTAMDDGNYAILGGAMGGGEAVMLWANNGTNTQTASAATIQMRDSNDPGTLTNPTHIWVAIFR